MLVNNDFFVNSIMLDLPTRLKEENFFWEKIKGSLYCPYHKHYCNSIVILQLILPLATVHYINRISYWNLLYAFVISCFLIFFMLCFFFPMISEFLSLLLLSKVYRTLTFLLSQLSHSVKGLGQSSASN